MTDESSPKAAAGSPGHGGAPFEVDVRERGRGPKGEPIYLERRLFMQLLSFHVEVGEVTAAARGLKAELCAAGASGVIYRDVNLPSGLAVLTYTEDPTDFVTRVAPTIERYTSLSPRPELTMIGRSYSTGFEQDLQFWLIDRPKKTVQNDAWPWAIWYPLRRTGAFNRLPEREKGQILMEHGVIGRAYGDRDLAHDVRLACHGLDQNDNEFLIGLVGKELHPLSHVVQSMRGTRQTSEYMEKMGPFFVGYALERFDAENG
ncbi:MAG: chlorite dismutase family protein [Myxococcales bacterium]|nr:chlorite dismutase family protein [Myxococcales bacterium]